LQQLQHRSEQHHRTTSSRQTRHHRRFRFPAFTSLPRPPKPSSPPSPRFPAAADRRLTTLTIDLPSSCPYPCSAVQPVFPTAASPAAAPLHHHRSIHRSNPVFPASTPCSCADAAANKPEPLLILSVVAHRALCPTSPPAFSLGAQTIPVPNQGRAFSSSQN
jgi:hypothetical protein